MWLSPEINFSGIAGSSCSLRRMTGNIVSRTDHHRQRDPPAHSARLICVSCLRSRSRGKAEHKGEEDAWRFSSEKANTPRSPRELGESAGGTHTRRLRRG